jgi:signal transduction histidine kinase
MPVKPEKKEPAAAPGAAPTSLATEADGGSRLAFYRKSTRAAAGELAAGVVHDINNPLQVMMLHLELLQSGRQMPNWIEMFTQQVQRISELTNRLSEFALSASREPQLERMDLNECVEAALSLVAGDFRRGGIKVQCLLTPERAEIQGNMPALRQVLLEMLLNSGEALSGGGEVRVETRLEGSRVVLRIADSGPGIPEEMQDVLFKPFVTTRGEGRAGIGLAICARTVAQHRGTISLEADGRSGASFRIVLPASAGH